MSLNQLFEDNTAKIKITMLVDFSNILHSTYHGIIRFDRTLNTNKERYDMWRYFLLNSIAKLKSKFRPDETILCIDGGSWRKEHFKFYKARRKLARENTPKDDFDYEEFFSVANEFIEEIKSVFPYKVIQVKKAEADDIVGVLCHHLHSCREKVFVISRDKDFKQLLKFQNVQLYDPITDKFLTIDISPHRFLIEHILKGDNGDDVPNIRSDDDVFLNKKKRQKRITQRMLDEVHEIGLDEFVIQNKLIENFERNRKMVELSPEIIPTDIYESILYEFNQYDEKPKGEYVGIMQFFRKHKIRSLYDKVDRFM